MSRRGSNKSKNNPYRPNIYGLFLNLFLAALNKGQLLPMCIAMFFIILSFRIPSEDIVPLLSKIFEISKINSILGWVIAVIITFATVFVVKWQRRIHTKEIKRISDQKKRLQQKLSKTNLPSSNN